MVNFRINVIINPVPAIGGLTKVDAALKRTTLRSSLLGAALIRALAPIATGVFLISGVKTLASFGQAMSTVGAISKATGDEFGALREQAVLLGRDTRFSATEAADGMTFLARAGFDAKEVLEAIGPTLDLAVAGNLELARAADISSNVLKGFRLPVSEMTRVLDVMALAANSSNTNVSQLGDAMKFVAPIAAGLGVSVEETAAAVGALSNAGLQASLAGTGLRKVLGELESPSDKSKRIFKDLGISADEVAVSQVGLTGALKVLARQGVTTANALELFGQRGGPAFEVMVNAVPEIEKLNRALNDAAGESKRVADIMDDNLFGALRRIRSAFQTLVIRLGDAGATGALRDAFESLARGLRFLSDNLSVFINAVQGITFVVAVRQIQILTAALIRMAIAANANPYVALASAIVITTGFLIAFRDEITTTEDSFTTLGDVSSAAFDRIKKDLESFSPLLKEIATELGDLFGVSSIEIVNDLNTILLSISTFGDTAAGIFLGVGNSLLALTKGIIGTAGEFVVDIGIEIVRFMKDKVGGQTIATFVAIGVTLRGLGQNIANFFSELNIASTSFLTGNFSAAAERVDQAGELLGQQVLGIGETFSRNLKASILKEQNDPDFIDKLVNPFEGAGEDMAAAMSGGLEGGLSFSVFTDFTLATLAAADAARAETDALAVQEAAQKAANVETEKAVALQEALGEKTVVATESVSNMATEFAGGFSAGLDSGLASITDISGAMETTMVNAFVGAEDALVDFVTTGEANFAQLADAILADITRMIIRMLVLAAINVATGGLSGGIAGIAASFASSGKAAGGPVRPGEPVMVGERGPELFIPPGAGSIATAAATAAAGRGGGATTVLPPPVNITVVNVTDPSEVVSAINSPEGEKVVLNIISRNRSLVKNNLA